MHFRAWPPILGAVQAIGKKDYRETVEALEDDRDIHYFQGRQASGKNRGLYCSPSMPAGPDGSDEALLPDQRKDKHKQGECKRENMNNVLLYHIKVL